jgi:hypothetical protein
MTILWKTPETKKFAEKILRVIFDLKYIYLACVIHNLFQFLKRLFWSILVH